LEQQLTDLLRKLDLGEKVKAAFITNTGKGSELSVIVSGLRQGIKITQRDGYRCYLIDAEIFEEDVEEAAYAEIFAHKLLQAFQPIQGEQYLRKLEKSYKKDIIIRLVKDLVSEHKLASLNMLIDPRYFLFEKVRRLVEVFPIMRSDISEEIFSSQETVKGFEAAAEELVVEGMLTKKNGFFSPTVEAIKSFEKAAAPTVVEPLRRLKILRESRAMSLLLSSFASGLTAQPAQLPDPENYVYMETAIGYQPLSKQLDITDFVKEFYGVVEVKIKRVGGVFNSTYVVEADSVKLFAKRYLSWTDVKWIAARIWTTWVKDFSINPSTRLAKEIYYLNHLRSKGFKTPEIIHVNWNRKILFTSYVEGDNLLTAWLAKKDFREDFSRKVGVLLAQIHDNGIRLGDTKPESFIKSSNEEIYVTDVEQASTDGDPSWDLMELIFYPGHYLGVQESMALAVNVVDGYCEIGNYDVVRRALRPSYVRTMSLWTPPWTQKAIINALKQYLKD